jgi:hypothetical protein
MKREILSIDIYKDKYPKPRLIDDGLPDVIVVDDTIIIPYYINSPTHIKSIDIVSPKNTTEKKYVNEYNNTAIRRSILCMIFCISIGIICIIIALKQNQPNDKI